MKRYFLAVAISLICCAVFAENAATTVILVRHAEKATQADDSVLTEIGRARADRLASILVASNLKAVYSSQYARTRLTAEPVAKEFGLAVKQINANDPQKLADDILKSHRGETVLVVGHSNTLRTIIRSLGGGPIAEILDQDYGNLYVITVYAPGKASVLLLRY